MSVRPTRRDLIVILLTAFVTSVLEIGAFIFTIPPRFQGIETRVAAVEHRLDIWSPIVKQIMAASLARSLGPTDHTEPHE